MKKVRRPQRPCPFGAPISKRLCPLTRPTLVPAQSIDEVLARLDHIIGTARRQKSRLGYFAALYRDVTARVKTAIEAGAFEDGPRMERLDVVFARRYLDALEKRGTEAGPPAAWTRTFDAAERWFPLVLQHLLLGMNAHINLDLGIAAVEVASDGDLDDLERDFDRINQILRSMIDEVQMRLAAVSPWLGSLDRLGKELDETISNFCLTRARDDAWAFAQSLSALGAARRAEVIEAKDQETARRTRKILRPGGVWGLPVLAWIRVWETDHVPSVITTLSDTWSTGSVEATATKDAS